MKPKHVLRVITFSKRLNKSSNQSKRSELSLIHNRTFGFKSEAASGWSCKAVLARPISRTALAVDDLVATKCGKLLAPEDATNFRLVRFDLQYNPTKSTNKRPSFDWTMEGGREKERPLEWKSWATGGTDRRAIERGGRGWERIGVWSCGEGNVGMR